MAQRSAPVLVEGRIVKSEHKHGTMKSRDTGDEITWDYIEARVLTDGYDTIDVRFPSDRSIAMPGRDELVVLGCEARVAGGNLRLDVRFVQPALALAAA